MRSKLQGFSSAFPGGWPGVGLLLLRAALGVTAAIQAGAYIGHNNPTPATWAIGLLAIASGSSLLIGFLTPVASVLVGLVAIFVAMSSFPLTAPNLLDAALPTVFLVVVAAAVVFLGPGALSLDARRFGRREIIIPRIAPSPKP
jgi:uncharacterized membrane protein YphA (DoxX/SURF4 family)